MAGQNRMDDATFGNSFTEIIDDTKLKEDMMNGIYDCGDEHK
jgi:hypothetical protein